MLSIHWFLPTGGDSRDVAASVPDSHRREPDLPSLARAALVAALGFAPFLLHGLATDPTGYWYAVVGFRVQAHSAFSVGLPFVGELGQTAPTVLAALLPVWLLACAALWGARWRTSEGMVALAFLLGALAGAAAGGYWYWHYYAGLVPPAALLAGAKP